jgi:biopolymer transport protein ExbB
MILHYINLGGAIAWILIGIGSFGVAIIVYKFIELLLIQHDKQKYVQNLRQEIKKKHIQECQVYAKEYINSFMNKKESGLPTIRTIATISPLLGLLGTVIGILLAFETISTSGMSDTKLFANGVSLALITTIIGLIVSIPHYVAYNYLIHRLDSIQIQLEKEFLVQEEERQ